MLSVNLFSYLTRLSLILPKWLVNYSRRLKSNRQWYSGNTIYCLVLKNKFKKGKHVYNKTSIISKQLSLMKLSLVSCPCPGFSIVRGGGHGGPHLMIFFKPPPIKTDASHGVPPQLKMKPHPSEKQTLAPIEMWNTLPLHDS